MSERNSAFASFAAATASALVIWFVMLHVHTRITDGVGPAAARVPYMIMGAVLFGLPLLAAIVLLVAWPAAIVLRRTIGISLPTALVAGALCGVAARLTVGALWGQPELGFLPLPVAVATGVGAAWVWWRVWSRPAANCEQQDH